MHTRKKHLIEMESKKKKEKGALPLASILLPTVKAYILL